MKSKKKGGYRTSQSKFAAHVELREDVEETFDMTPKASVEANLSGDRQKALDIYEERGEAQRIYATTQNARGKSNDRVNHRLLNFSTGLGKENSKPNAVGAQNKGKSVGHEGKEIHLT